MCTVTLSPLSSEKSFVLTSNRDEAPGRPTLEPRVYVEEGVKMLFPKDKLAGGTWLGVSERQRLLCLLNGGFEKHERKSVYGKSRGVVVKELLAATSFSEAIENYDLTEVEPFTLIVVEWQKELSFSEVVWDGKTKHFKNLILDTHIWSSSPLYSSEAKREREKWFSAFRKKHKLNPENILEFHFSAGKEDKYNGVIMDRGFVKTRSISQVILSEGKISFYYKDLETEEESEMSI